MSASAYQELADSAAKANGIPPSLFSAMIQKESSWNPNAVSSAGAIGLGQLMPNTYPSLGVTNPFDPEQNINGAASYLGQLYKKTGNWFDALRSYNAGPTGAANSAIAGRSYANSILGNARINADGSPMSGADILNATQGGVADYSPEQAAKSAANATSATEFLKDPAGYLKGMGGMIVYAIVLVLVAAALAWFGIQQTVME